jgi:hypothetical protein
MCGLNGTLPQGNGPHRPKSQPYPTFALLATHFRRAGCEDAGLGAIFPAWPPTGPTNRGCSATCRDRVQASAATSAAAAACVLRPQPPRLTRPRLRMATASGQPLARRPRGPARSPRAAAQSPRAPRPRRRASGRRPLARVRRRPSPPRSPCSSRSPAPTPSAAPSASLDRWPRRGSRPPGACCAAYPAVDGAPRVRVTPFPRIGTIDAPFAGLPSAEMSKLPPRWSPSCSAA